MENCALMRSLPSARSTRFVKRVNPSSLSTPRSRYKNILQKCFAFVSFFLCPHEESNLNYKLRKLVSYPLNDKGFLVLWSVVPRAQVWKSRLINLNVDMPHRGYFFFNPRLKLVDARTDNARHTIGKLHAKAHKLLIVLFCDFIILF